jgi:hypothetical protein
MAQTEIQNVVPQERAEQCIYERWKSDRYFRPRLISNWLRAAESDQRLFELLVESADGTNQCRADLQELLSRWIELGRPDLGVWPQNAHSSFNIGALRAHLYASIKAATSSNVQT